jgi:hypothetical protein
VEKKIQTCQAYLIDLKQKNESALKSIEEKRSIWFCLDLNLDIDTEKKVSLKKEDLHALAAEIIPLYLGKDVPVLPPQPILHSVSRLPDDSYSALAAGYVESYPCLRPFFLHLINSLTFPSES